MPWLCASTSPPHRSSLKFGYEFYSSSKPQIPFSNTLNFYLNNFPPQAFHFLRNGNRSLVCSRNGKRHHISSSLPQGKEPHQLYQETENADYSSSSNSDAGDKNDAYLQASSSQSLLSFFCPLLKLLSGGDPSQGRNYLLEEVASSLSTLARLPWGSRSLFDTSQLADRVEPVMRLQIFEFEACPFCRRVREALTELDLSAEIYPCPKGSVRNRETVRRIGGKEQFPLLVDPNTGISLYESSDIVKYLFQQYGKGRNPSVGLLESTIFTGWMPTLLRAGRGMSLWERSKKEAPPQKLELFSYENNPFARIVREALCELELPYILLNVGEGSTRLPLLFELSGSKEVPYLVDPNTGEQIGDYKRIVAYLFRTYSVPAS